jgi:hypothetical protein
MHGTTIKINAYVVSARKPDGDGQQEDLDVDGRRLTKSIFKINNNNNKMAGSRDGNSLFRVR